jgi:outer membrane protein insertion porin family
MNYNQWYISLGLSTGYSWSTFLGTLGLNGGVRFGLINNSYEEEFIPFDPTLRGENGMWTPKNSIWTSASLDQRDIYYDPSRGFYLYERLSFYGILPNEKEHYFRSDSKAQYFHTLFDIPITNNWSLKSVFAANLGFSLILPQLGRAVPGTDPKIPAVENSNKLALDGMFVGRGWGNEYSNKGLMLVDTWMEFRFPLVPGILAWDFFLDAAGVETVQGYYFREFEGKANFTFFDNMRFSLGGGLRVTMPQFPIRISLAKRFKFVDKKIEWQPGSLFNPNDTNGGLDIVFSFTMSY